MTLAHARAGAGPSTGPIYARALEVEVFDAMEAARPQWQRLETLASVSPYQTFAFCDAWMQTVGAALGRSPSIAVARAPGGEAIALIPLCRFRRGPLVVAEFPGGRMANYQMGLFLDPGRFSRPEVEALLRRIAEIAGIDVFVFRHQPVTWRGRPNPLSAIFHAPSPSFAHSTELGADIDRWMRDHHSSTAAKKRRAKTRKLEALGPVSHLRAQTLDDKHAAFAAFLEQKRARMQSLGLPNEFDDPTTRAFVARLSGLGGDVGDAGFEFHVARVGERIVSVYAGLLREGRLSGLLFSHDVGAEIAPHSPGELLILALVRDAYARGLPSLDFGVGEARYKSQACEVVEPLFDSAFAVTILGRIAATAYLLARRLKWRVKRTPGLFDFARTLQRLLIRPRARRRRAPP